MNALFAANGFQISLNITFHFNLNNYTENKNGQCFYYQHHCYFGYIHQQSLIYCQQSHLLLMGYQMKFVYRLTQITLTTNCTNYVSLWRKVHTSCPYASHAIAMILD